MENLQETRLRRSTARNEGKVRQVLELACRLNVSLVDLENLARSAAPTNRGEQNFQGLMAHRRHTAAHKRALNANRQRWDKYKKFLEGSTTKEEKIAERVAAVGSVANMFEGAEVIPQPEAQFIPSQGLI